MEKEGEKKGVNVTAGTTSEYLLIHFDHSVWEIFTIVKLLIESQKVGHTFSLPDVARCLKCTLEWNGFDVGWVTFTFPKCQHCYLFRTLFRMSVVARLYENYYYYCRVGILQNIHKI